MPMRGRRPGLKGRLDAVQGHAHATMNTAQQSIKASEAAVLGFFEELLDGVTLEVVFAGKTMPIKIRIVPREDDETE